VGRNYKTQVVMTEGVRFEGIWVKEEDIVGS
jgi:hypothetical protein